MSLDYVLNVGWWREEKNKNFGLFVFKEKKI